MFSDVTIDPKRHGPAGLRTFLNISKVWHLSRSDQMAILGISDPAQFDQLSSMVQQHEVVEVPMDMIVRIGCVLSIYGSLVTLYDHDRTEKRLRAPMIDPKAGDEPPCKRMGKRRLCFGKRKVRAGKRKRRTS